MLSVGRLLKDVLGHSHVTVRSLKFDGGERLGSVQGDGSSITAQVAGTIMKDAWGRGPSAGSMSSFCFFNAGSTKHEGEEWSQRRGGCMEL